MALAARRLGAPAVVVMPTTAPAVKVDGARAFGAEVLFAGTTSIDRKLAAEALASERGLTIVPPFDHADIIAGQGTAGLEIVDQRPDVKAVYVPVGGGGLISGVAAAVKRLAPSVRLVGVEPAGAPKMTRSLAAGQPTTLDAIDSIADGLLAVRPGDLTFAHVAALVDEVVTVTDDEIRDAMRFLVRQSKLVAEPSGAASVAGALQDGAGRFARRARRRRQRRQPRDVDVGCHSGRRATVVKLTCSAALQGCTGRTLAGLKACATYVASNHLPRGLDTFLDGRDLAVELTLVDLLQQRAHARTRRDAEIDQVAAEQQRPGRLVLDAEAPRLLEKPVHRRAVECARPSEAVRLGDARQPFHVELQRQPPERDRHRPGRAPCTTRPA